MTEIEQLRYDLAKERYRALELHKVASRCAANHLRDRQRIEVLQDDIAELRQELHTTRAGKHRVKGSRNPWSRE